MTRTRSSLPILMTLLIIGAVAAGAYFFLFRDLTGPSLALSPDTSRVGPAQTLTARIADPSGVRRVKITVRRNTQSLVVLNQEFSDSATRRDVSFTLRDAKLPEGSFELEIRAYDGSYAGFGKGNSSTLTLPMRLDSQPPRIAVKTVPPGIRRGGSALIVYTVSEDVKESGVRVGDFFFPGHRQPNGAFACLFPFPYTMSATSFSPEIMARDMADNVTSSRLLVNIQNRGFKADTVSIGDSLLSAKADELAGLCPDRDNPLDQYLCVNTKVRRENDAKLLELGQTSSPGFFAAPYLKRLPRSAVKAGFGDFRTYLFNGEKIDEQTHTGLDLASVAHADIPAAQAGRVIFTGYLGIYGNMVLVDHGLGLMTLYAHMSEILTEPGAEVQAGGILGKTGTTGMAVGDHVHFGVLVGGLPVNPIEWLDAAWVRDNIVRRLAVDL
ncbi:MAG: peptidoglycan DD-metalloendopeptidase family protein [Desulfovibrionaceae bacterium]|nr:peptidoglycan DD-metalloendopeptidase family protein [Desulfovibrionaceae bacterium]